MNIFYLHQNPEVSAKAMTNKHVVKMILESAQMLSTAHQLLDGPSDKFYKAAYMNHPSTVWVRQNVHHYMWLLNHFIALSNEYTIRYGKQHATYIKLSTLLSNPPKAIANKKFMQPPQAMPDIYKDVDSIQAYRRYYLNEKIKNDDDLSRFVNILNRKER
jgi:hypothetical protein